MSRHRRANSDLAGLKTLQNIKKSFHAEKETVGRTNRTFSNRESPLMTPTTGKINSCPESSGKKLETQETIISIFKLTKHFYEQDQTGFYAKTRVYLRQDWESCRKAFIEHLNKLPYVEQGMQKLSYAEIEEEILKEWKKNPVLYYIRATWYDVTLKTKFKTIGDFLKSYNTFRDYVGQVAYLIFRGFFAALEKKGNNNIIDRLTERTAHFIITYSTTWNKIYDRVLLQLLKKKATFCDDLVIEDFPLKDFDLNQIDLTREAVDIKQEANQLPLTTDTLDKFTREVGLFAKIKLLIKVRETLEKEIMAHQEQLIMKKQIKKFKVLDKDDFISSLIYCVVRGDINFQSLGLSLKYFQYAFGTDLNEVLSKFECASYMADLDAVFDYLLQWKEKQAKGFKNLGDIQINKEIVSPLQK